MHDLDLRESVCIVRRAKRPLIHALTVSVETVKSVFHHCSRPPQEYGSTKGLLFAEPTSSADHACCRARERRLSPVIFEDISKSAMGSCPSAAPVPHFGITDVAKAKQAPYHSIGRVALARYILRATGVAGPVEFQERLTIDQALEKARELRDAHFSHITIFNVLTGIEITDVEALLVSHSAAACSPIS